MEKETKETLTEEQVDKALDAAIDIIYEDLAVEVDREEMDVPFIVYLRGAIAGLEQIRKERRK